MAHKLTDLLGDTLVRSSGEKVQTKSLCGKEKIVGLYFAAEWCPPCKGFTPKLVEFYKNFKNGGTRPGLGAFEIVYVSWDKDEAGFRDSLGSMPWTALPFGLKDKKVSKLFVCQYYNIHLVDLGFFSPLSLSLSLRVPVQEDSRNTK